MIHSIKGNFKNSKLNKKVGFSCVDCLSIGITNTYDSQQHVLSSECIANQHLRHRKNFEDPQQIVNFFKDLTNARIEREKC